MASYAISESAEFTGEWFLPGADGASPRIAGALSWSEQRATLALHEAFTKLRGVIYGTEEFDYPAIHGTTTKQRLGERAACIPEPVLIFVYEA